MKELLRVDGLMLSLGPDGTIWLGVLDGAGTHDTSLTDEGAEALMGALVVARRFRRKMKTGSYFTKDEK